MEQPEREKIVKFCVIMIDRTLWVPKAFAHPIFLLIMSVETETAAASQDRYECPACGYIYEPNEGDARRQIPAGTPFERLPEDWACPVCGASAAKFKNVGQRGAPSGFEENLKYGFGVNTMTPAQKNILIFAGLGFLVLFLLSFYGLS